MHESGATTPTRGCRSTRSHLPYDFSHTTREFSLHPPVDESGCSCSALGASSFHISPRSLSLLMSLSIEDETSIPRLISLHPTCLRSRLQQTLISSLLPFYRVEPCTSLRSVPNPNPNPNSTLLHLVPLYLVSFINH